MPDLDEEDVMMRTRLSATLAAGLAIMVPAPALATIGRIIGGPGGTPFELRCPAGTMAVGINAHAGAWIDGLSLLCSTSRRDGREPTQAVGSDHSSVQEAYCPRGSSIRGVGATFTNGQGLEREYLNSLNVFCDGGRTPCIDTGEGCSWISDTSGPFSAADPRISETLFCPEDEVLVGLVGQAGKYVDAIGAICGPGPGTIGRDRPLADERTPPSAYQDRGDPTIGEALEVTPPVQALPTSPNPDVNAGPTLPASSVPTTQNVSDGLQRNLPPPVESPR